MPLLQPFVAPGLVILGAGIGAAVASSPATPEEHDDVPAIMQELRVDGAVARGASSLVGEVSDAAAALEVPLEMVTLAR